MSIDWGYQHIFTISYRSARFHAEQIPTKNIELCSMGISIIIFCSPKAEVLNVFSICYYSMTYIFIVIITSAFSDQEAQFLKIEALFNIEEAKKNRNNQKANFLRGKVIFQLFQSKQLIPIRKKSILSGLLEWRLCLPQCNACSEDPPHPLKQVFRHVAFCGKLHLALRFCMY